ncbi:MAG: hypothetical protein ACFHWX_11295 [Bacteroidota bacterium]
MRKSNFLPFLLILLVFAISCNEGSEDEQPDLPGTSTITVSGAESGTINTNGAEFTYTVSSVSGGEFSDITIYMGNYGTTETALQVKINELNNTSGFDKGTYNYDAGSTTFFLTSVYVTDNNSYLISPGTDLTNKLTLTSIASNRVKGSFEVNLESFDGDKVKLTGSFEAEGETFTY